MGNNVINAEEAKRRDELLVYKTHLPNVSYQFHIFWTGILAYPKLRVVFRANCKSVDSLKMYIKMLIYRTTSLLARLITLLDCNDIDGPKYYP